MKRALVLSAALIAGAASAQANLLYWPLANANAPVCAYVDNAGKDWKCGSNRYSGHKGTDIAVGVGNGVLAAAPGTVNKSVDGCPYGGLGSTCGGGFGNVVGVFHGGGVQTIYGHMSAGSGIAALNSTVGCGQRIGATGSSGNSSGPHVHFQVNTGANGTNYYSGTYDDPFAGACGGPISYWKNQGTGYVPSCGPGAPSPQSASTCGAPQCPAGTYALWNCNAAGTSRTKCTNGNVQTEACANGCQVNPIGTDDVCKPPPAPTCPAGTFALWNCNEAGTERVRCTSGNVETEACAHGCEVKATGTDDVCKPAPPTCAAGTSPDWTCNEAGTELRRCIGGVDETKACTDGCSAGACLAPSSCPSSLTAVWTCDDSASTRTRCIAAQVEQQACANGCVGKAGGEATCAAPRCPPNVTEDWACTPDGESRVRCGPNGFEVEDGEGRCGAANTQSDVVSGGCAAAPGTAAFALLALLVAITGRRRPLNPRLPSAR